MPPLHSCAVSTAVGDCFATAPEVRSQLGQEYVGKNVDALVRQWGPPTSTFEMNSGESSCVWQLSAVADIAMNNGAGSAATYACKVSVIALPTGIVTQLKLGGWRSCHLSLGYKFRKIPNAIWLIEHGYLADLVLKRRQIGSMI
jgi:hypothetical protein